MNGRALTRLVQGLIKFAENTREKLQCPICLDYLKEPVRTRCNHIFCKQCIEKTLRLVSLKCPVCKHDVSKRSLVDCDHLDKVVSAVENFTSEIESGFFANVCQNVSGPTLLTQLDNEYLDAQLRHEASIINGSPTISLEAENASEGKSTAVFEVDSGNDNEIQVVNDMDAEWLWLSASQVKVVIGSSDGDTVLISNRQQELPNEMVPVKKKVNRWLLDNSDYISKTSDNFLDKDASAIKFNKCQQQPEETTLPVMNFNLDPDSYIFVNNQTTPPKFNGHKTKEPTTIEASAAKRKMSYGKLDIKRHFKSRAYNPNAMNSSLLPVEPIKTSQTQDSCPVNFYDTFDEMVMKSPKRQLSIALKAKTPTKSAHSLSSSSDIAVINDDCQSMLLFCSPALDDLYLDSTVVSSNDKENVSCCVRKRKKTISRHHLGPIFFDGDKSISDRKRLSFRRNLKRIKIADELIEVDPKCLEVQPHVVTVMVATTAIDRPPEEIIAIENLTENKNEKNLENELDCPPVKVTVIPGELAVNINESATEDLPVNINETLPMIELIKDVESHLPSVTQTLNQSVPKIQSVIDASISKPSSTPTPQRNIVECQIEPVSSEDSDEEEISFTTQIKLRRPLKTGSKSRRQHFPFHRLGSLSLKTDQRTESKACQTDNIWPTEVDTWISKEVTIRNEPELCEDVSVEIQLIPHDLFQVIQDGVVNVESQMAQSLVPDGGRDPMDVDMDNDINQGRSIGNEEASVSQKTCISRQEVVLEMGSQLKTSSVKHNEFAEGSPDIDLVERRLSLESTPAVSRQKSFGGDGSELVLLPSPLSIKSKRSLLNNFNFSVGNVHQADETPIKSLQNEERVSNIVDRNGSSSQRFVNRKTPQKKFKRIFSFYSSDTETDTQEDGTLEKTLHLRSEQPKKMIDQRMTEMVAETENVVEVEFTRLLPGLPLCAPSIIESEIETLDLRSRGDSQEIDQTLNITQTNNFPRSDVSTETEYLNTQSRKQLEREIIAKKATVKLMEQRLKNEKDNLGESQTYLTDTWLSKELTATGSTSKTVHVLKVPKDVKVRENSIPKDMVFVISGLTSAQQIVVKRMAQSYKAKLAEAVTEETTHVIIKTDDTNVCSRTLKYLMGVANHCCIVNYKWVNDCMNTKRLLSEDEYEVIGDMVSGTHEGPRKSRLSVDPLFKDYDFHCIGNIIGISKDNWFHLLNLCGARHITDPSLFSYEVNRKSYILVTYDASDHQDYKRLFQRYRIPIVDVDWVLNSLSSFTLKPISKYLLGVV